MQLIRYNYAQYNGELGLQVFLPNWKHFHKNSNIDDAAFTSKKSHLALSRIFRVARRSTQSI